MADTHTQRALGLAGGTHGTAQRLEFTNDGAAARQHRLALGGEPERFDAPVEQHGIERALQPLDLLGDGRLRERQVLGHAGDRPGLRQQHEGTHLFKHDDIPNRYVFSEQIELDSS